MTMDLKYLTYQECLDLPEMKARYSIVDGELMMAAAPTPDHQTVVLELSSTLRSIVCEHRLGRVFVAPLDSVVQRDPLRTRQPDILFITNARRYIIGQQVIEGGPDLVIEILFPLNTLPDVQRKLQDYQRIGVREAWIVGTQGQTVEVLQLSTGGIERSGLYGLGDAIISQVLPELWLTVDEIFTGCRRIA
jgi:Uma2 family endonuclease